MILCDIAVCGLIHLFYDVLSVGTVVYLFQTVDDFLVRQLYYPYRLWKNKTQKQVIPIFLFYSNDIFSFYIYRFTDDKYYNSIEFVKQNEKLVDTIKDYDLRQDNTLITLENMLGEMKEIDLKGSFESDDEVGVVFSELKNTIESYKNKI